MANENYQIQTNPMQTLVGLKTLVVANTNAITDKRILAISVTSDATVDVATGYDENGNEINFYSSDEYKWQSLKAGDLLLCGENRYISNFQLDTAGRVLIYYI